MARKKPVLSILLPTIGRSSLARAIESIPILPEVQIVIIGDGYHFFPVKSFVCLTRFPCSRDCGYSARNVGLPAATGKWLAFMDDDDYFAPGAVESILEYCGAHTLPALFKMQRRTETLWIKPALSAGNQGQQQFVCPNRPDLPRWDTHYSADFDWMEKVVDMFGGCNFIDKVTVICTQQKLGEP